MRHGVVHAASEVVGFAKTGGLADVAGSLPRALEKAGRPCTIILPLYRAVRAGKVPIERTEHAFAIAIGPRLVHGRLWRATLPDSSVPVYLVEQPDYFERDEPTRGRGLYQFALVDGTRRDYPDNCERFIFFGRAVLEALRLLDCWPDLLHNHDWQTGLIPVFLEEEYRHRPGYDRIRTVFTIHNIAYQGLFPASDYPLTGLDWRLFNYQQLEFHGQFGFLKAGIVFSQRITTVSPRYSQEIQTPYFGCGLQGVLAERRQRLTGIVNGIDDSVWNPATDLHLAANYTAATVAEGKPICKEALQRRHGLSVSPRAPLIGMVARLVEQKGMDLVSVAAEAILQETGSHGEAPPQLVVLGEGEPVYHRMLLDLQSRYPDRVGVTLGFDETLAHQIEAGADLFLMPSQFEPSGLNQLYSLKYGTVPVVRATGGLYDTIVDCTPESLAAGTATGFRFLAYTPAALLHAVQRALETYREHPNTWLRLVRTGMNQDWSWERSAGDYERLYSSLVRNP